MSALAVAFFLLASHAVCDFALQSEAMAKGKNRHNQTTPPPGAKLQICWQYWLGGHALIHGAGVALVTGLWWLGLCEALAHAVIDFNKCDNRYGIHTDQALHIACKVLWLAVFLVVR